MYTDTMPLNPLLEDVTHPDALRIIEGSTDKLAQATRPRFLRNNNSPVQWTSNDWDRLEADRGALLDMESIRSQIDRERFLIDGYAIFENAIKPTAQQKWLSALKCGQQMNDLLLTADWSNIDWYGLGRSAPAERVAPECLLKATGGSQAVPQKTDVAGVRTLRLHSVFAEYFPAGHLPYLMNVITHKEMLELQRLLLGSSDVYFDHNQLLSRPAGYVGGNWHSHKVGPSYDSGIALPEEYDSQPNAILTLCYLNGFQSDEDGGLKIIRGSHLFRDPTGCVAKTDEEMENGWLNGRIHPITGKALEIEKLALPPGSIVCCLSHAAHGVASKVATQETRWSFLICYRKKSIDGYAQPPSAVPPIWAMKAHRDELPPVLTELLRPSFDRELTDIGTQYAT